MTILVELHLKLFSDLKDGGETCDKPFRETF